MAKILLLDIPAHKKEIPNDYYDILNIRVKAESIVQYQVLGGVIRGRQCYSRGILQIASSLQKEGHDVLYLSSLDEDLDDKLRLILPNIEIMGISCMTNAYSFMNKICVNVKRINPHLTIIAGGWHVTYRAEETLEENRSIDIIVKGDGCLTFPKLLNKLDRLDEVPNISFRNQKGDIHTICSNNQINLSKNPIPAYDLLPYQLQEYSHNILSQIGCKYNCLYCLESNTPVHYIKIENILKELLYLQSKVQPGTLVYLADDVLSSNRKRCIELARLIAKNIRSLKFVGEIRPEDVDKEILKELVAAGFVQLNLGIEDSNDEICRKLGRTVNITSCIKTCELIRDMSKCLIGVHWLTGLPNCSTNNYRDNIEFINEIIVNRTVDIVSNKIIVPYPGTTLFEKPTLYGITLRDVTWDEYDRYSLPVFDTSILSAEEIYHYFIEIEKTIITGYLNRLGVSLESIMESSYLPVYALNQYAYLDS